jgi:glucokinase
MYLVFDTGGTKMRMAYSPDGRSLETPKIFPTPREFDEGMKIVAEVTRDLVKGRPIKAMAGGMPGPMDPGQTMVTNAPNMPGWNNQPLKQELERIVGAPVFLENDTTMVGLGEVYKGAGRGYEIVSYITVSTGIGGKRFVKGQVEPSAFGFEPGHMIIDIDGFTCNCGLAGHLEGLASGNGVRRRFGKAPETIKDPEVWKDVTHYLAAGLINVSVMWSPHCIVLGGSMMKDISIENVKAEMEKFGLVFKRYPELQLAQLGDTGGLEGALAFLNTAQHIRH